MAVMRAPVVLRRALREWRNGRRFSGWTTSGGYNVGLRSDGITIRWTVLAGLCAIAFWRRLWMETSKGSFEGVRGM
jgi:hypothetical protein